MAGRSVSFGDVEEQVYEDNPGDYWREDEEAVAGDYWDGDEGQQQQSDDNNNNENPNSQRNDKQQQQQQRNNNSSGLGGGGGGSSSLMCPQCGSRNIESEPASGASICVECGVVVEENAIVSAVEFVEGNGGASSMVGQFVAQNASRAYGSGSRPAGRPGGYSSDSRETTLLRGRRRIQDVAGRLRLGPIFVDAAHRLFTVAVEKNFVQGRRTTHVVAACLYISCRQEKSQHMLIDFSDALQVNVYTLGATFLKFRRLLGLKLEIIDPALYVYRFAAHLDLDDKANAVALTALRLVGRMKRDWIVTGRRPAGICAAALLISARAHGFSRHQQDVTRILRVCGLTVNTRVREFEQTPSAALTLTQFNAVDLEQEMDPPRYTKNKIMEARAKAIQEGNIELLQSGALDDPLQGRAASRWRDPKRHTSQKNVRFKQLYLAIDKELSGANNSNSNNDAAAAAAGEEAQPQIEEGSEAAQDENQSNNSNNEDNNNNNNNNTNNEVEEEEADPNASAHANEESKEEEPTNNDNSNDRGSKDGESNNDSRSNAKPKGRLKDPRNYEDNDNNNNTGEESNNKNNNKDGEAMEEGSGDNDRPRGQLKDPQNYDDNNEQGNDNNDDDNQNQDQHNRHQDQQEVQDDNATRRRPAAANDESANNSNNNAAGRELVEVHPDLAEDNQTGKEAHQQVVVPEEWKDSYPKTSSGKSLVMADHATPEEMMKPTAPVEAKLSMSEWKEDLPDSITDEIDSMFRSEEEVAKKEVIFNKINKEYIEQQERKEKERLSAEAAGRDREEDDAGQAEAHRRYMKSNRGRKKKRDGAAGDDLTTEEALLAAVNNRKISRRINYDAMSSIFDDDGAFANDTTAEAEGGGDMEFGEL